MTVLQRLCTTETLPAATPAGRGRQAENAASDQESSRMRNYSTPWSATASAVLAAGLAFGAALGATFDSRAGEVDVGVSVQVNQPGVYGRIDIGTFPRPQVVVVQPVFVTPPPRLVARPAPVYMWVRPGHRKHWSKHCGRYGACGVPVYFVRDDGYQNHVEPHARGRGKGKGHEK
jgi:hypothetical protein